VIAYVDSSVLVRAYLPNQDGHDAATALLGDLDIALVTGSWTRVEVSGALVRAARGTGANVALLLALLDGDVGDEGPVTVVGAPQREVEEQSLALVREHGLRAMDAWHLATALLTLPSLAEPNEDLAFASRDRDQAAVAERLGFALV
jgi:predicted nucleic acid-binding protein